MRSGGRSVLRAAVLVATWSAVVALAVRYSTGFGNPIGLFPIAGSILTLPALLIGLLIWGLWGRRKMARWSAVLFAFFVSATTVSIVIGDWQVRQTKLVGLTIVDALDRFAAKNGAYPAKLDGLVPEYLPTVPCSRVGTGEPFQYRVVDECFALSFDRPAFLFSTYRSEERKWIDHD